MRCVCVHVLSSWAEDAKLWPHLHPYGSGSLYSERGSGGMYRYVQNRLLLVQSGFRSNNLYAFWFLNRCLVKDMLATLAGIFLYSAPSPLYARAFPTTARQELFGLEKFRRMHGRGNTEQQGADAFSRAFGTAMPNVIPESSAWQLGLPVCLRIDCICLEVTLCGTAPLAG